MISKEFIDYIVSSKWLNDPNANTKDADKYGTKAFIKVSVHMNYAILCNECCLSVIRDSCLRWRIQLALSLECAHIYGKFIQVEGAYIQFYISFSSTLQRQLLQYENRNDRLY